MLRRRSPSAFSSTSRTSPKSLTIPVNIESLADIIDLAIRPHQLATDLLQSPSQRLHGISCKRLDAVRTDDFRPMEQHRFIDQIGGDECGSERRGGLVPPTRGATRGPQTAAPPSRGGA